MQKLTLTVIISQACMIFYVSQSLSPAVSKYNYEVSFVRRHLPRNLVTLRSRGEALRKAFFAKGKNTTCDEASEEIRCTASTRPFWNNVVHDPYNKDFFANQQLFMLYSEAQRNTQKAKFWKHSRPFTNPPPFPANFITTIFYSSGIILTLQQLLTIDLPTFTSGCSVESCQAKGTMDKYENIYIDLYNRTKVMQCNYIQ